MSISFDLETFSECDLKKCGAWRYATHPSTDVLCASIRYALGAVLWLPDRNAPSFWTPGVDMFAGHVIEGYNVRHFDALIWFYILTPRYGWPWPGWQAFRDTMVRAAATNLPGSLDAVAQALGTPPKDAAGHKLMMSLSKPARAIIASNDPRRHHTPDALDRLAQYCAQDTVAEAAVSAQLPQLSPREQAAYEVDFTVNHRGVHLDMDLVRACMSSAEGIANHHRERLATLTNGTVDSETDLRGLANFCRSRGVAVPTGKGAMDKAALEAYLDTPGIDPGAKAALEIRQMLGRSSLAKLQRMVEACCDDGRIHGMLAFYGAHQTGRWSGKIVQLQNLPRQGLQDYDFAIRAVQEGPEAMLLYWGDEALGVITALLRPCLNAAPGHELAVADYNAIECRVAAWLADETQLLDCFRTGRCPYKMMAALVYGVPYEAVTKAQRALGKVIILACGYGMGPDKFQHTALTQYHIDLTVARAAELVHLYRQTNARIKAMWYLVEDMAKAAIRNPGTVYAAGAHVLFKFDGINLRMRLPSGRHLWYRRAHLRPKTIARKDGTTWETESIYFMAEDDHGNWGLCDTYGGKLFENCFTRETLVLTSDGWTQIADVKPNALVWDGAEWACTDGPINQGEREVGRWLGVHVTQNHLIHDGSSWQRVIDLGVRAAKRCLSFGRASVPWSLSTPSTESVALCTAYATADAPGPGKNATSGADESAVLHAATVARERHAKTRISYQTATSGRYGFADTVERYLVALTRQTERTQTTGAEASGCAPRGWLIAAYFFATRRRFRAGISLAWTWIASTITETTSRGTSASLLAARIPTISGPTAGSNTGASGSLSPSSTGSSVTGGWLAPSSITSPADGILLGSWTGIGRETVYDLLNCGPRNRFVVLTNQGPVVVHNCCQAISRDVTADALVRAEQRGLSPVLTVHDELVCEVPRGTLTPRSLEEVLCEAEPWAATLPVKAEAFVSPYYKK